MMSEIAQALLFGFFGGVVRVFVGVLKRQKKAIEYDRMIFTLLASGVVGAFAALFVSTDYRLTLLAGYAGTDFIESVYKIVQKKGVH